MEYSQENTSHRWFTKQPNKVNGGISEASRVKRKHATSPCFQVPKVLSSSTLHPRQTNGWNLKITTWKSRNIYKWHHFLGFHVAVFRVIVFFLNLRPPRIFSKKNIRQIEGSRCTFQFFCAKNNKNEKKNTHCNWSKHKTTPPSFNKRRVFPKIGVPQMDGLQWKTLLKLMIWGYHYFRKHPDLNLGKKTSLMSMNSSTVHPFYKPRSSISLPPKKKTNKQYTYTTNQFSLFQAANCYLS